MFVSGTERLYLSYAQSYDTNRLKMSPYLKRVVDYLDVPVEPKCQLQLTSKSQIVTLALTVVDQYDQSGLSFSKEAKQVVPLYWQQLKELVLRSDQRNFALTIFESQDHLNVPVSLSEEMAEALYGKEIYTSISRMENFYNCEYKYFVQFGLKLKERNIYGLTPAATGDFLS